MVWTTAPRDGTPAVLDVATFPVGGKNRTALPSAQGAAGQAQIQVSPDQAAQDAQRSGEDRGLAHA